MRRKFLILSCISIVTGSISAQVGINIQNPQGMFHFDGKSNSPGVTTDDVIVKNDGKTGIGTVDPMELLHVEGRVKNTGNLQTNNLVVDGKGLIKEKTTMFSPTATTTLDITSPLATVKIEDTDFSPNKYLTSDGEGDAYWDYLRPDYKAVGINETTGELTLLYNNAGKEIYGGTYIDLTDNPLVLSKGKWLILARFTAWKVGSGTAGTDMLLWAQLRSKPASQVGAPTKVEVVYGFKPEISGWRLVTPSLSYMVDIAEDTEYRIFSTISVTYDQRFATRSDFGGSFFSAIRLDDKYTE